MELFFKKAILLREYLISNLKLMKRTTFLTSLAFLCLSFYVKGQILQNISTETITVNSKSSLTGYTRNIANVTLPSNATAYIYRITVFNKGNTNISNSLFNTLKNIPITEIRIGAFLTEYAINQNDGNSVDFFVFTNGTDANSFYSKGENINYCKSHPNRSSVCVSTNDCINQKVYFGFRNNNIQQGVEVILEVVALVSETQQNALEYTHTIKNGLQGTVFFQISEDSYNWQNVSLQQAYTGTYRFKQPYCFVKISTQGKSPVVRRIESNQRYILNWNQQYGIADIFSY
jgi:hypothetical protein